MPPRKRARNSRPHPKHIADASTAWSVLCRAATAYGERPLVGVGVSKESVAKECINIDEDLAPSPPSGYCWTSYKTFTARAAAFGSGLQSLLFKRPSSITGTSLSLNNDDVVRATVNDAVSTFEDVCGEATTTTSEKLRTPVGIALPNCIEWLLADWGCVFAGATSVPLYDSLLPASSGFEGKSFLSVAHRMCLKCIIISRQRVHDLTRFLASEGSAKPILPFLRFIIVVDTDAGDSSSEVGDFSSESVDASFLHEDGRTDHHGGSLNIASQTNHIIWLSWHAVEAYGVHHMHVAVTPDPCSYATITLSSGSTGDAKAMTVTHGELIDDLRSVASDFEVGIDPDPVIQLAIYSFAYGLERDSFQTIMLYGGMLALFDGDFLDVFTELERIQPTTILGVPALWNVLYTRVYQTLLAVEHMTVDAACSYIGRMFGRRLTVVSSGTAPLAEPIAQFLHSCFGSRFIGEGYGTSETGLISLNGYLCDGIQVKLKDRPELGFFLSDLPYPRGEILVKSEHVARYFDTQPEYESFAFTHDGFFKTGDIGELSSETSCRHGLSQRQRLRVIDRCASLFKAQNGEFVSPSRLEALYLSDASLIDDIYIMGKSNWPGVGAVVRSRRGGLSIQDLKRDLDRVADMKKLRPHEKVVAVIETQDDWSPASGMRTACLKMVRSKFLLRYSDALERLIFTDQNPREFLLQWFGVDDDSFRLTDAAIDSMNAVSLALTLQNRFQAPSDVLSLLLDPHLDIQTLLERLHAPAAESSASVSAADMAEKDAAMDLPIIDGRATTAAPSRNCYLLTGGTGFIGTHVLDYLLRRFPQCHVLCLMRPEEQLPAPSHRLILRRLAEKLQAALSMSGLDAGEDIMRRIEIIPGDLGSADLHFGLPAADYADLARRVGKVFHLGATVDWIRGYQSLRHANVLGTAACLGLGCPILFASSGGVKAGGKMSAEHQRFSARLFAERFGSAGYLTSKAVAEFLCLRAQRERGQDVTIVRIGMTSPRAWSCMPAGSWPIKDFISRLVLTCVRGDISLDLDAIFEMLPVDFVAASLVELFMTHSTVHVSLESQQSGERVWTLSNALSPTVRNFCAGVRAGLAECKRKTLAELASWTVEQQGPLLPLILSVSDPEWWAADQDDIFSCPITAAALRQLNIECPPIDSAYLAHLRSILQN